MSAPSHHPSTDSRWQRSWQVLLVFLRLGLTSFGGPSAHLGYFREAFVQRLRWLDERAYADLVALCQFLPGPASSQVGMGIGLMRAGHLGALAAWIGFTLPSAIVLMLTALGMTQWGGLPSGLMHGLKLAAVAVVAHAVWGMAQAFCTGWRQRLLMLLMTLAVLLTPQWPTLVILFLLLAGLAGYMWLRAAPAQPGQAMAIPLSRKQGIFWLLVFAVLLALAWLPWPGLHASLAAAFYRAGSLVFGGGHVVLPLLETEVVQRGWLDADIFLAGYGLTQAVPGPLFTFAAFLGAAMQPPLGGWWGGLLALLAIFLPAYLLIVGALPFWEQWRHLSGLRVALHGVNAAVVGLLLAALLQQGTLALRQPLDVVWVLLVWLLLWRRLPPWLVVLLSGLAGQVLSQLA